MANEFQTALRMQAESLATLSKVYESEAVTGNGGPVKGTHVLLGFFGAALFFALLLALPYFLFVAYQYIKA